MSIKLSTEIQWVEIIITVILIPLSINLYSACTKFHKRYLFKKILMDLLNKNLDKITPNKFKGETTFWCNKFLSKFGMSSIDYTISFTLIEGDEKLNMVNCFVNKIQLAKSPKSEIKKIFKNLHSLSDELNVIFSVYGDVTNKKLFRNYHIINFNIRTIDTDFDRYDEDNIIIFAENIYAIIMKLDETRNYLVKNCEKLSFNNENLFVCPSEELVI